jgi:hypothetical protein
MLPFFNELKPLAMVAAIAVLIAGCGQRDDITRYTVPKPEVIDPTLTAKAPGPAAAAVETQTLGLIIPSGEMSWFFKLTGPKEAIEPLEEAFMEFVKTVKLSGGPDAEPTWTLPGGWQQLPGSQFRYATIRMPTMDSGKPPDITVSQAGGDVLSNINRWRGQLNLKPVSESGLAETTEKLEIDGREATYVSLVGTGSGGMGGAPFAPFAGGALPPDHPPIITKQPTTTSDKAATSGRQ